MRRAALLYLLLCGCVIASWQSFAQMPMTGAGVPLKAASSACSQATTFLSRTSGLDATHQNAYITLICGLVTDNVWNSLDVLYVMATADSTTATFNLVSTSFTLTPHNSPTFTANQGFTAIQNGGSSAYLDTGFAPNAGTAFIQNSAHFSLWTLTVGSGSGGDQRHGAIDGGAINGTYISAASTGVNSQVININGAFDNTTTASNTAPGFVLGNRSGASAVQLYWNGSSSATGTTASTAPIANTLWLGARDFGGGVNQPSAEQMAASSIGGSLTSGQVANLCSRLSTYLVTIAGISSVC